MDREENKTRHRIVRGAGNAGPQQSLGGWDGENGSEGEDPGVLTVQGFVLWTSELRSCLGRQ